METIFLAITSVSLFIVFGIDVSQKRKRDMQERGQ
jgi:hypothetical protein